MLRLIIDDPVAGTRYSLQKDDMPFAPVIATDGPLSFDVPVTLQSDGRLTGPFVRREGPERRFIYIRIGVLAGDHASCWNRRAKVDIHDIPKSLPTSGDILEAHLPGSGKDGSPACATVRRSSEWTIASRR